MWDLDDERTEQPKDPKPDPREARSQEPGSAQRPPSAPEIPEPLPPQNSAPEPLDEIRAAVTEALSPVVAMIAEASRTSAQDLKEHAASLQQFSGTLQELRDVKAVWAEARNAAEWLKRQRETYKAEMDEMKRQLQEARETVTKAGKEASGKAKGLLIAALIVCAVSSTASALIAWSLAGKAQEKAAETAPTKEQPERPASSKRR